MKRFIKILPICLLTIFAGCIVTSIHPFYTEDVVVFDPSLLGEWVVENEEGGLTFVQDGENQYKMILKEEKDTIEFDVHLVKLQDRLFLDLYPSSSEKDEETFFGFHFLSLHSILLIKQIEPTLQLAPMSQQWLRNEIQNDPSCIAHEIVGDRILLTSSSQELQKFVAAHVQTEGAFETADEFTRKTHPK
jgi:hypothetical protein